ncbi:hypothetical protein ACIGHB_29835 [Streptomyces sp. NPDC085460]|uniref:hypothetical protein n=1 Tax=Streptomyces sp. NPDC085460 TaxID=3365723 RepID=UPI0037CD5F19
MSVSPAPGVPAPSAEPTPFHLSPLQGEAARQLLDYTASLPLPGPEAQLLATVVAIRAAHGGAGNITGADLSSLRLSDPHQAVDALRKLGWQIADTVFDLDPTAPPTCVTVPDLARTSDHPLPVGKHTRSRVSGWTTRTLSAKPLRKLPPAARLAGLFLAAHCTARNLGPIPSVLPAECWPALAALLEKGFVAELSDDQCRLAPQVAHLSGVRAPDEGHSALPGAGKASKTPSFDAAAWTAWKAGVSLALRRHAESIENCALCGFSEAAVAWAFTVPPAPVHVSTKAWLFYKQWKDSHPDRGLQAAAFTVEFREQHGHGPSFRQLGEGLGWNVPLSVRHLIVQRLLHNCWLTATNVVPWTLRPGPAAQEQGIALPQARGSHATTSAPTSRP